MQSIIQNSRVVSAPVWVSVLVFTVFVSAYTVHAAAAEWQMSGNNAYYNVGNVGIGKNNPIRKLDVRDVGGNPSGAGYFLQKLTAQNTVNPSGLISLAENEATSVNTRNTYGIQAIGRANPSAGVTLNGGVTQGMNATGQNSGAGDVRDVRGVRAIVSSTGGGDIIKGYGLHSACQDSITCYGLYIQAGDTNVTTDWGVYATGEDRNYFSGRVGIGTASPTAKLDVAGKIKATQLEVGTILIKETNSGGFCMGNCAGVN